jgi:hypothetical protein
MQMALGVALPAAALGEVISLAWRLRDAIPGMNVREIEPTKCSPPRDEVR